jgi:hypothetical protein
MDKHRVAASMAKEELTFAHTPHLMDIIKTYLLITNLIAKTCYTIMPIPTNYSIPNYEHAHI